MAWRKPKKKGACRLRRRAGHGVIAGRQYRRQQLRPTWATAEAVQRAGNTPATAGETGDATDNLVGFAVFSTTDLVAFKGMNDAVPGDAVITLQHLAAALGLVAQANEISNTHPLPVPSSAPAVGAKADIGCSPGMRHLELSESE